MSLKHINERGVLLKEKYLFLHIIVISSIIWGYYYIVGPLVQIGGIFFDFRDFLFPVLGLFVVIYLYSFKTTRKYSNCFKWKKLLIINNVVFLISMLAIMYIFKDLTNTNRSLYFQLYEISGS